MQSLEAAARDKTHMLASCVQITNHKETVILYTRLLSCTR